MIKFDLSYSTNINSRVGKIWRILLDPTAIKEWLNGAKIHTNWELNSHIQFQFESEQKPRFDQGKIVEFVENERLVLNLWSKDYGNEDHSNPYKVVTYDLKYLGNEQSRLTLTVSSFDTEEAVETRKPIVESIVNKIKALAEA